jgi:hypothetical protein
MGRSHPDVREDLQPTVRFSEGWATGALIACAWLVGCGGRVVELPGGGPAGAASAAGTGGALASSGSAAGAGAGGSPAAPAAGGETSGADPFVPSADCAASPGAYVDYSTSAELDALLARRWQRCIEPQIPGEELGVEFTSDGKYYPLYRDTEGNVARRTGVDFEKSWTYAPAGSIHPISNAPSASAYLVLDSVITDPPKLTTDPEQLRITFTPVLARYTPLD